MNQSGTILTNATNNVLSDILQLVAIMGAKNLISKTNMQLPLLALYNSNAKYFSNQVREKLDFDNAFVIDIETTELILFDVKASELLEKNYIRKEHDGKLVCIVD